MFFYYLADKKLLLLSAINMSEREKIFATWNRSSHGD